MANLLEAGKLIVEVVDIIYCGVVVKATNAEGKTFYFAIDRYPHNIMQDTKPVDTTTAPEAWPDRSNVDMDAALAYWIARVEKNANGTRKGGAFAEDNFSLKGIPIGATLKLEIIKNTDIDTVVMVHYGELAPFQAYACSIPSPQRAVDVYTIAIVNNNVYIRVVTRAPHGPDYPGADCTIGGMLNGGCTVKAVIAAEMREEGGVVLGDNLVRMFYLGERNDPGRDPRFMPFTYLNPEGAIVEFGCNRGSSSDAVVQFVIPNVSTVFPWLAKATDTKEIVGGTWMPIEDFLVMSNDPAETHYVAWTDHQAGARAALEKLEKLKLI